MTLLKDGVVVKTIQINSLPKAPPEEQQKPTATSGTDPIAIVGLLILLVLVVLGVIFWRGRASKGSGRN